MLIYGKEIREKIKEDVARSAKKIPMSMVVVRIGDDKSSQAYVNGIKKFGDETGVNVEIASLSAGISLEEAVKHIEELNQDPGVNGIMLQTPLPPHLDVAILANVIDYHKDVEGINNYNLGKLISKQEGVKPATPKAVISMLKHYDIPIEGKRVCIVGRSAILGSPLAMMMSSENGTVTLCHSRTRNLGNETRNADILVAALGKANYITPDMVNEDSVIIDVGINFDENGRMVGDVHEESKAKARIASAVPGGVGLITVAELFDNLRIISQNNIV
ncbi:MAG: bifunctional 5,10-methylenetetrahydrofolate dehydrogenase/5,10-methenyltetrahydrofolate cyclohydrolase [Syntrophomonadaceae bacterium]|nr:bifunctional 5,10-methylenetetrahydrofolate dehydrogenase/5,10-methenyltetrahydrofolate cyclohydrolase [Syntrophomonadaceae bacterium]